MSESKKTKQGDETRQPNHSTAPPSKDTLKSNPTSIRVSPGSWRVKDEVWAERRARIISRGPPKGGEEQREDLIERAEQRLRSKAAIETDPSEDFVSRVEKRLYLMGLHDKKKKEAEDEKGKGKVTEGFPEWMENYKMTEEEMMNMYRAAFDTPDKKNTQLEGIEEDAEEKEALQASVQDGSDDEELQAAIRESLRHR